MSDTNTTIEIPCKPKQEEAKPQRKPRLKVTDLPPAHPWHAGMRVTICLPDDTVWDRDTITEVLPARVRLAGGDEFRHHDALQVVSKCKLEERRHIRPETAQEAAVRQSRARVVAIHRATPQELLKGLKEKIRTRLAKYGL